MVAREFADPRRHHPAQHQLDLRFRQQFKQWKDQDPTPQPEHALPNSTVQLLTRIYSASPRISFRIIADLVVIAYFFLLRVCEYTKTSRVTRTVPLRRQDIQLWRKKRLISHSLPLEDLLQADAVTICLENQKNGIKGAVVHHTSSGNPAFDPVRSMARLVFAIQLLPEHTQIGSFIDRNGSLQCIQPKQIVASLRFAAVADNLATAGFNLRRIGSHSLRSGGAVNLKLNGYDHDIIKKLGRWSSNTYLHYIQNSIGELTTGVATKMATTLRFHRVGT
jgi:hypothetical protein